MSEPIKTGDLVMVVRGHSCVLASIGGVPFRVNDILPVRGGGWHCNRCGEKNLTPDSDGANLAGFHSIRDRAIPLKWLRRITPLGELGDVPQKEEIHA